MPGGAHRPLRGPGDRPDLAVATDRRRRVGHNALIRRSISSPLLPLREFLRAETAGGFALLAATIAALAWANLAPAAYEALWHVPLAVPLPVTPLDLDARHWVNDGAMAVFFFVVGLEIKRELVDGELRRPRQAALPLLAAVGGVVLPALIYLAFNRDGDAARGWGIPMATDIAFAVGVLALVSPRVPIGLKVFLLSVAIVDDIGAIAVIAVFYSAGIELVWLAAAAVALTVFRAGWRMPPGPARAAVLVAVAALAWVLVQGSGVHATIAGVALGLLVPAGGAEDPSAAERLEHTLHPWTSLLVVPVFALANAGVVLAPDALRQTIAHPVALGVFFGLAVGKVVGIGGAAYAAIRLGVAERPAGVTWAQLVGASALGGIGFTVSLFISQLAFTDEQTIAAAKIGTFAASLTCAAGGYLLLRRATRH